MMKMGILATVMALLVFPLAGADLRPAPDLTKQYRAQHIEDLEIEGLNGDELALDELSVCCPKEYKAVVITMRQMDEEEKRAREALAEHQRKPIKLELPPEPSGPVAKDAAEFAAKYSFQPAAITCQTNERAGTISYRVECKDVTEMKTTFETLKTIPNRIRITQGTNYVTLAVRLNPE